MRFTSLTLNHGENGGGDEWYWHVDNDGGDEGWLNASKAKGPYSANKVQSRTSLRGIRKDQIGFVSRYLASKLEIYLDVMVR